MGQTDALTDMNNRNSYHQVFVQFEQEACSSMACVYIDVNGLHEINNHLGHYAGDEMLKTVANAICSTFGREQAYRIGGDEFVVLCRDIPKQQVQDWMEQMREMVKQSGYFLSVGMEYRNGSSRLNEIINAAETKMQQDKKQFYAQNGGERQTRALNDERARMMTQKQDMDTFLSILKSDFIGTYFVNVEKDQARPIFSTSFFDKKMEEEENQFSVILHLYTEQLVHPEWRERFRAFCSYENLMEGTQEQMRELVYQRTDGSWLHLEVKLLDRDCEGFQEMLWVLTEAR